MNIRDEMTQWLTSQPSDVSTWARNYLAVREAKRSNSTGFFRDTALDQWIEQLKNTDRNELLLRKMKQAWAQKLYRDGQVSKKSYSFLLEATVKEQLDFLAKRNKKTISETLEELIKRAAGSALKADTKKTEKNPEITSRIRESRLKAPLGPTHFMKTIIDNKY